MIRREAVKTHRDRGGGGICRGHDRDNLLLDYDLQGLQGRACLQQPFRPADGNGRDHTLDFTSPCEHGHDHGPPAGCRHAFIARQLRRFILDCDDVFDRTFDQCRHAAGPFPIISAAVSISPRFIVQICILPAF